MPARGPEKLPEIACLGLAFHVLAWYMDDAGSEHACIASVGSEGETCRVEVYDPQGCNGDSVEFVERSLARSFRVPTLQLEVSCSSEPGECYGYSGISSAIAARGLKLVRRLLEAVEPGGRELFIVVGWNGGVAYGLGGETSVRLPGISAPFFAHTHPSSICYPSHRDVESTAGFLAEGGIVSLISSLNCTFVFRLVEPFVEEDYWRMLDIARRIRSAKDYEGYANTVTELSRLKSVTIEVM